MLGGYQLLNIPARNCIESFLQFHTNLVLCIGSFLKPSFQPGPGQYFSQGWFFTPPWQVYIYTGGIEIDRTLDRYPSFTSSTYQEGTSTRLVLPQVTTTQCTSMVSSLIPGRVVYITGSSPPNTGQGSFKTPYYTFITWTHVCQLINFEDSIFDKWYILNFYVLSDSLISFRKPYFWKKLKIFNISENNIIIGDLAQVLQ